MSEHLYCSGLYRFFIGLANLLSPFVLLLFRLVFGWLFLQAGIGKFGNIEQSIESFSNLGIPAPAFNAWLVAFVESFCGLALFLGFCSRILTVPLIVTMLVALGTANYDQSINIFSATDEFVKATPVPFLMAALTVFLFGPGCFSVDYLVEKVFCKNHCNR